MDKLTLSVHSQSTPQLVRSPEGSKAEASVRPEPEEQKPLHTVEAEDLDQAVQQINDFVQTVQRDLRFSVDEGTGRVVVTVRDSKTDEVIRQIPSEEMLALAENLEEARGFLLRTEV